MRSGSDAGVHQDVALGQRDALVEASSPGSSSGGVVLDEHGDVVHLRRRAPRARRRGRRPRRPRTRRPTCPPRPHPAPPAPATRASGPSAPRRRVARASGRDFGDPAVRALCFESAASSPTGVDPPSSSSGLGRCPFKAVARVRIPLGARYRAGRRPQHHRQSGPPQGPVAQLVSASPCHGEGRGFESRRGRSRRPVSPGVRRRSVAQLEERPPEKRKVRGSNPLVTTLSAPSAPRAGLSVSAPGRGRPRVPRGAGPGARRPDSPGVTP